MPIQVEDGINWSDLISRIESMPRGQARQVSFFGTGKTMVIEHYDDGTVRLQILGDGDERWIYPPSLKLVADILRRGIATRVQA